MAVIGLQPIMLKDATFTVAEDDYTASVTQVVFTPQVLWTWHEDICSGGTATPVYAGVRWTVSVGYLQDLSAGYPFDENGTIRTALPLTTYLLEHAAQTRTVVFAPKAGGTAVRADVMIVPGPVGGVPNQQLTSQVTMPLFEEPTLGTVV